MDADHPILRDPENYYLRTTHPVADEEFEKTPKKANRWFRIAIVLALLYGATFSLNSFFNWVFFFASAYAFFMSYFLLPAQPKIFQGKQRPSGGWTRPAQKDTGRGPAPADQAAKVKRIMFIIAGTFFGLFFFFFIIGIMNPEPPAQEYEDLYANGSQPTASDLVNRGNDLFNNQEYDSAGKYYDRAYALDHTNMEAIYGKGIVLYATGNEEQAMPLFRQSYEGGFRFAWLSWVLADMHEKNGNSAQAALLYKESVNLDSSFVDSYKRLAELEPENSFKYLQLAEKHGSN